MKEPGRTVLTGVAVVSAVAIAAVCLDRTDREVRGSQRSTVRIADIQGAAHVSPLVDQWVSEVPGVVTAVLPDGFFMQDPLGDDRAATSEGLFVFTAGEAGARVGDRVAVGGRVVEHYPGGRSSGDLPTTQLAWVDVRVLSSGHDLPSPISLTVSARRPGERALPRHVIENDAEGDAVDTTRHRFDPDEDALDFFESLEGMLVRTGKAVVVGPLNRFGELVAIVSEGSSLKPRTARGGLRLAPGNSNPERLIIADTIIADPPPANVGDSLLGCVGIVHYSFGSFKVLNTEPLELATLPRGPESRGARTLTVASYNVFNLHHGDAARVNRIARQIVGHLGSPDIIALQEMQDDSGKLNDDVVAGDRTFAALVEAIAASGGPRYDYRQIDPEDDQDGGDPGANIRVGYLFQSARVDFIDPFDAPALDGTAELEGRPFAAAGRIRSRVFAQSRKPLLAQFRFAGEALLMINVHQSSRHGSAPRFGRIQPPPDPTADLREGQAGVLRDLVSRLLEADPGARVVVLGDFNDTEHSPSLQRLGGPLVNLTERLPLEERYTYIYRGNSQALDHILVTKSLAEHAEYEVVHINADFAGAASDHDPVVARLEFEASE